ncbi:hypothetical protein BC940DRAFT_296477 [Gongronella butleri]|nr:hypothetical protein BC940DRAFT_296477 [Gongronella butleri]
MDQRNPFDDGARSGRRDSARGKSDWAVILRAGRRCSIYLRSFLLHISGIFFFKVIQRICARRELMKVFRHTAKDHQAPWDALSFSLVFVSCFLCIFLRSLSSIDGICGRENARMVNLARREHDGRDV